MFAVYLSTSCNVGYSK